MMLVDHSNSQSPPSLNLNAFPDLPLSSSLRDVDYCCGACGYELNLSSSNRNTSLIGSKRYGKSIKSGIMSFFSIDETRFTLVEQLRCKPYFVSPRSWGLFRRRIKLLCRRCGNHVGSAYRPVVSSSRSPKRKQSLHSTPAWGWDGIFGAPPTYEIRIRAIQPSSENSNIFSMI